MFESPNLFCAPDFRGEFLFTIPSKKAPTNLVNALTDFANALANPVNALAKSVNALTSLRKTMFFYQC